MGHALVAGDQALGDQPGDVLLEGLRALGHQPLHRVLDAGEVALVDHLGDQLGVEQHLDRRHAAALGRAQQPLRDDRAQAGGQVGLQRRPRLGRVERQDAAQRMVAVVGMHRRQHQVAGERVGQRRAHRLAVADLADEDAVRRLPHRVLQADLQRLHIAADLALVHHRLVVGEQELDRILDGQDVPGDLAVAVLDHRGHRGALAGAGGADHQHQTALGQRERRQDVGQAERLQRRDLGRHEAEHAGDGAALLEGRQPEGAQPGDRHADIELAGLVELLELGGAEHLGQQLARLVRAQRLLRELQDLAVDLDQHRHVGRQEHVGSAFLGHQPQDALHVARAVHRLLPPSCSGAARSTRSLGRSAWAISRAAGR